LIQLNLKGTTIPHQVIGRYGSAQVLLKPAAEGTGVIAGGPVRKVMQVAGIHNVLTKSIGTSNPHNVIKATFAALLGLKDAAQVAENPYQDRRRDHRKVERKGGGGELMSAQKKTASSGTVKIKWVVSFISCTDDMRQTIRGLGLRRLHQIVERQDTPETRGMIHKVRHLVEVVK